MKVYVVSHSSIDFWRESNDEFVVEKVFTNKDNAIQYAKDSLSKINAPSCDPTYSEDSVEINSEKYDGGNPYFYKSFDGKRFNESFSIEEKELED